MTQEPLERLEAELRAQMPASLQGKQALARYWSIECYGALQRCDYGRAAVAGRLCREADPHSLAGALGGGIAAAYFGHGDEAQKMMGWALRTHGLLPSVSWGLAWMLAMLGNWPAAEAYLLDAAGRWPAQATVRSLLGYCQWQLGKVREAEQSVRRAVGLEPGEPGPRILLGRILLASGRAREALQELEAVEQDGGADFDAALARVSANLRLGRAEEAARRVALRKPRVSRCANSPGRCTRTVNRPSRPGRHPSRKIARKEPWRQASTGTASSSRAHHPLPTKEE